MMMPGPLSQTLRNIVDALDGHVVADLPMDVGFVATLAAEIEAIAVLVGTLEDVAVSQAAIDAFTRLEAEVRAARLQ